jgi:peroxiredoxin
MNIPFLALGISILMSVTTFAQIKPDSPMKLTVNQQAPVFSTTDVYNQPVNLQSLRGHKIYLAFMRNTGCPVCNLRVHELLKKANYFAENNIQVLLVYESSVTQMRQYLEQENYPFTFIPDPENKLYRLYDIERSTGKMLGSVFRGAIGKALAGQKLYHKKINQDGHANTIPADFLIDETGKLSHVHYGNDIGDHIPISELR